MTTPNGAMEVNDENKTATPSCASASPPSSVQHLLSADPLLADLVAGLPVCFAGIPYAKETERQQNFLHSAQMAKRLHIAIPSNGINLHLNLIADHLLLERNELHFASEFLFNGARVRLRGHIGTRTLHGKVQVELAQQSFAQRQRNERIGDRMAQLRAAALRL